MSVCFVTVVPVGRELVPSASASGAGSGSGCGEGKYEVMVRKYWGISPKDSHYGTYKEKSNGVFDDKETALKVANEFAKGRNKDIYSRESKIPVVAAGKDVLALTQNDNGFQVVTLKNPESSFRHGVCSVELYDEEAFDAPRGAEALENARQKAMKIAAEAGLTVLAPTFEKMQAAFSQYTSLRAARRSDFRLHP